MKKRAFTLLELLIVVAIIAILATLVGGALSRSRKSGALVREIAAGRQMVAAYVTSSSDHDGQLLVGYASGGNATDDLGAPVMNPANGRYPWRLAPYLQYQLRGVMLVNEQEYICKLPDHADFVYRASAYPSFGINATYVGGNQRMGMIPSPAMLKYYGQFVCTRLSQVAEPSKLIVFASSRYSGDASEPGAQPGDVQAGFHLLSPPRTTKIEWDGKWDPALPAEKFGYLDLRHAGRAVCVMLGGNVELLNEKEVQDMRHWSVQAAEADDAEYILKPIQ